MTSNIESIAQSLHEELDDLISQVSRAGGQPRSAHAAEEQLWAGILGLGRGLMQLCFTAAREAEVIHDEVEVNGVRYGYRGPRQRGYVSLFGEVQVERAYYWSVEGIAHWTGR